MKSFPRPYDRTDSDAGRRWRTCNNPAELLGFYGPARVCPRLARLIACGYVRHLYWPLLADERSRRAVELAERHADGEADDTGREAAWEAAWAAVPAAGHGVRSAAQTPAARAARAAARVAERRPGLAVAGPEDRQALLCDIYRDVLGEPFRRPRVAWRWQTWNGGAVVRVAAAVYEEHRFGELPVLADALQEAGCADPEVLGHCRTPGVHVRGCWLLDALLGKR